MRIFLFVIFFLISVHSVVCILPSSRSSLQPASPGNTNVVAASSQQRAAIANIKSTCPFMASAVKSANLRILNSLENPLAFVNDIVQLGNSGGGNLGNLLSFFANGNQNKMQGAGNKAAGLKILNAPVPKGTFSLDFPGSQGAHPGHSGVLMGVFSQLDTGRFSSDNWARLTKRAVNGYIKRSDIGKFIAENLVRDRQSKVLGTTVTKLLAIDAKNVVSSLFNQDNKVQALAKLLGEDNLVGSSGEFGLLLAFLHNSPLSRHELLDSSFALSDLTSMFVDHVFPPGWEKWQKIQLDWLKHTTGLAISAGKEYFRLKNGKVL